LFIYLVELPIILSNQFIDDFKKIIDFSNYSDVREFLDSKNSKSNNNFSND